MSAFVSLVLPPFMKLMKQRSVTRTFRVQSVSHFCSTPLCHELRDFGLLSADIHAEVHLFADLLLRPDQQLEGARNARLSHFCGTGAITPAINEFPIEVEEPQDEPQHSAAEGAAASAAAVGRRRRRESAEPEGGGSSTESLPTGAAPQDDADILSQLLMDPLVAPCTDSELHDLISTEELNALLLEES